MTAGTAPDATFSIAAPCRCYGGRRLPPLRVRSQVAAHLVALLRDARMPLTVQVLEYRCSACEAVVPITLGQLLAAT